MAPREKARNRSSKAAVEEYALLIDGAPLTCRWQELKDFIREYAPHSRQAEMYEDENGKPTGRGSVIVTRLEEAQRAYRALSRKGWDGHCIKVALAKRVNGGALDTIEGPTISLNLPPRMPNPANPTTTSRHLAAVSPPISPKSNGYPGFSSAVDPHTAYYANANAGTYPPQLAAHPIAEPPNVMTLPYGNAAVSPHYAPYQDAHYVDAGASPPYLPNVVYNPEVPAYGHHFTAPNPSRDPVLRTQASRPPDAPIVSPNRTVFLTKLPYSAVGQAVRRLLEAYGRVERCDVPLDKTSPNKIQGTAIAKFKETTDAARAIRNLNGAKWKGVTISARWDRDSASTNAPSAASALGRPAQARHGSSGTVKVADARGDDSGARDQPRRTGQGPLIVNGSRGVVAPSRSRRGSKEDDSDSSDEDDEDDRSRSDEDGTPGARRPRGGRH